jgi:hypothetical protein
MWLDGQPVELSNAQSKVAQEVKGHYAEWANKIGLPQENRVSDYLTHIFEPDFANNKRIFPEELAKILDYITPNKEFNPFLEKRTGAKGYKLDYLEAMDAYVYRSARKLHLDEPLGNAASFVENMPGQAAKYTDDFLKNFKNRPTDLEKAINQNIIDPLPAWLKQKLGNRPVNKLISGVTGQVYRGTIGLNLTSPLKNLTQFVNTYSQLGERYTAEGYVRLLRKGSVDELVNNHVLDDIIIAEYKNVGMRSKVAKMDKVLFYLFELTEKINRGSAYFGAKAKFLNEGVGELKAIEMAKDLVRKTQFGYGKLHTPLALQSPIGKLGFQLSTFAIKQAEFVGGMVKNKETLPIIRYVLASLAIVYASKKFLGNVLGLEYTDALFKNAMPHLGPIPQYTSNFFKYATAKDDNEKEYYADKLKRAAFGLFVPAGSQMTKTYEGLTTVGKGYSETKTGNIRYPVQQNVGNYIIGGLGGQYRLPEARTYFDTNARPLSDKQSQLYTISTDKNSVYKTIIQARKDAAVETKVKEQVKKSGTPTTTKDKYIYLEGDTVKTIDLNPQITPPKLTGDELYDKKLTSTYNSGITSAQADIIKLVDLNQISMEEGIKQVNKLEALRIVAPKVPAKPKKPKKLKAVKVPKVTFKKTKKTKLAKLKIKPLGTTRQKSALWATPKLKAPSGVNLEALRNPKMS